MVDFGGIDVKELSAGVKAALLDVIAARNAVADATNFLVSVKDVIDSVGKADGVRIDRRDALFNSTGTGADPLATLGEVIAAIPAPENFVTDLKEVASGGDLTVGDVYAVVPSTTITINLSRDQTVLFFAYGTAKTTGVQRQGGQIGIRVNGTDFIGSSVVKHEGTGGTHEGSTTAFAAVALTVAGNPHTIDMVFRSSNVSDFGRLAREARKPTRIVAAYLS